MAKTVGHFCSKLPKRFANLPDHRDPDQSYYPTETIAWSTTLMFLLGLGSLGLLPVVRRRLRKA